MRRWVSVAPDKGEADQRRSRLVLLDVVLVVVELVGCAVLAALRLV
ncbi:hypothetical protein WMF45_40270 [Sorangium sp. So ce448]